MALIQDEDRIGVVLGNRHHELDILIIGDDEARCIGIAVLGTQNTDVLHPELLIVILGIILFDFQGPVVLQVIGADDIDLLGMEALTEPHRRQCLTLAWLESQNIAIQMKLVLQRGPELDKLLLMGQQLQPQRRKRFQAQRRNLHHVGLAQPAILIDELSNRPIGRVIVGVGQLGKELYQLQTEEFGRIDIIDLHVSPPNLFLLIHLPGPGVILILENVAELGLSVVVFDPVEQQVAVDTLNDDATILGRHLHESLSCQTTQDLTPKEFIPPFAKFLGSSSGDRPRIYLEIGLRRRKGSMILIQGKTVQSRIVKRPICMRGIFAHHVIHERIYPSNLRGIFILFFRNRL